MNRKLQSISNLFVILIYTFLLAPLCVVILFSFSDRSFLVFPPTGFSLRWYQAAWSLGTFEGPALRSIFLAVGATLMATIVAIPAALGLRRLQESRWVSLIEFMLLAPLVVPAIVIGIALLYFFIRLDLIDTFQALLAAHTLLVFPFCLRSILVSALNIKPHFEEASDMLGATPLRTFRSVILPGLLPGITSGAIFAFIVSFDQFTVSLFVTQSEQTTLPVALYRYVYDVNDPVAAAVSSALVVSGLFVAFGLQRIGLLKHVGGRGAA